jgi:hypothetical protein
MDEAPLIVRRMPAERHHLARDMTGHSGDVSAGTWWELVDALADTDLPPAGVALTHAMPDGTVTVSALGAGQAATVALPELLRGLTAVLRGHATDLVIARSTDPAVVPALLTVGFIRTAEDCYVLVL